MKVLMTKSWEEPEYLDDGMLHGMRSLFGNDVVEFPRMTHMYASEFGPGKRDITKCVARGFTYYGMMDDSLVDRTDLESKIKNNYFDLILMHPWYQSVLTPLVLAYTPKNKIAWLDGRDERQILDGFVETGRYFKRELISDREDVLPISFGFPYEKIQSLCTKIRSVARCIAGDTSTYNFYLEGDYYHQYNEALFGITRSKNGWDCLRHYEIMGSRCVPWFLDLSMCPPRTCTTLPKADLLLIKQLIDQYGPDIFLDDPHYRDLYEELRTRIHNHFINNCTTAKLAKYVIDSTIYNS